jgi:hypothetical protein
LGVGGDAVTVVLQGSPPPGDLLVAAAPLIYTDTWTKATWEHLIPLPQALPPGTYVCIAASHTIGALYPASDQFESRFLVKIVTQ